MPWWVSPFGTSGTPPPKEGAYHWNVSISGTSGFLNRIDSNAYNSTILGPNQIVISSLDSPTSTLPFLRLQAFSRAMKVITVQNKEE